jgi:hypothetical protein
MLKIRRRLIAALACSLGSLALAIPPAAVAYEAQRASQPYGLFSLEGDYAVVGTYGSNVARLLGTFHADGRGNLSGSATVNLPGAGSARVVVGISYKGTYTVNDDGTGVIYFTVTLPGGATTPVTLDLATTKAEFEGGVKVATEIATSQREPSSVVDAQFVTHVATRLPDKPHDHDRF